MIKRNTKIVTAIASVAIMTSIVSTSVSAKTLDKAGVDKQLNMIEFKLKLDAKNGVKHDALEDSYANAIKNAIDNKIITQDEAKTRTEALNKEVNEIQKSAKSDKDAKSDKNKEARATLKNQMFGDEKTFKIMKEDNDFKGFKKLMTEYKGLIAQGQKEGLLTANEIARATAIVDSAETAKAKQDKKDFKKLTPSKTPVEKNDDELMKEELKSRLFGYKTTFRLMTEDKDFKNVDKYVKECNQLIAKGEKESLLTQGEIADAKKVVKDVQAKANDALKDALKTGSLANHDAVVNAEKEYNDAWIKYGQEQAEKQELTNAVVAEHDQAINEEKEYDDAWTKYGQEQANALDKAKIEANIKAQKEEDEARLNAEVKAKDAKKKVEANIAAQKEEDEAKLNAEVKAKDAKKKVEAKKEDDKIKVTEKTGEKAWEEVTKKEETTEKKTDTKKETDTKKKDQGTSTTTDEGTQTTETKDTSKQTTEDVTSKENENVVATRDDKTNVDNNKIVKLDAKKAPVAVTNTKVDTKVADSKKIVKTGSVVDTNGLIGIGSALSIAGAFIMRKFRK